MPFCPACGMEVPISSDMCPQCGKKLDQFRKSFLQDKPSKTKRSIWPQSLFVKIILGLGIVVFIGLLIMFVVLIISGFGQVSPVANLPHTPVPTTIQPSITSSTVHSPTSIQNSNLILQLGQSALNDQRQVTVTSATKASSYQYYSDIFHEYSTYEAEPGKTFLILDCEVKNLNEDKAYVGAGDFSLADVDGNRYDPEVLTLLNDQLPSFQDLYRGQKINGKVIFITPESSSGYKLYYDFGNLFTGTRLAIWEIPNNFRSTNEFSPVPRPTQQVVTIELTQTPSLYPTYKVIPKFSWGDIIADTWGFSKYVIVNENMETSGNYIVKRIGDCPNPSSIIFDVEEIDSTYRVVGHQNPATICD